MRGELVCDTQPAPKYHTKGCSHSSADSPGARTLVFAAFEPFHSCEFGASIARTPFCVILWRFPRYPPLQGLPYCYGKKWGVAATVCDTTETQCDRGIATPVSQKGGYFGRVTKSLILEQSRKCSKAFYNRSPSACYPPSFLNLSASPPLAANGWNTVSESTVSNTEMSETLSEFLGPHRVPGRELTQ